MEKSRESVKTEVQDLISQQSKHSSNDQLSESMSSKSEQLENNSGDQDEQITE